MEEKEKKAKNVYRMETEYKEVSSQDQRGGARVPGPISNSKLTRA